jgi:hypothetical protein
MHVGGAVMTGSVEAPSAPMTGAVIASGTGNDVLASPTGCGPSVPELDPEVPEDEPDPPEDVVEPEPDDDEDDVELFVGPPP